MIYVTQIIRHSFDTAKLDKTYAINKHKSNIPTSISEHITVGSRHNSIVMILPVSTITIYMISTKLQRSYT